MRRSHVSALQAFALRSQPVPGPYDPGRGCASLSGLSQNKLGVKIRLKPEGSKLPTGRRADTEISLDENQFKLGGLTVALSPKGWTCLKPGGLTHPLPVVSTTG